MGERLQGMPLLQCYERREPLRGTRYWDTWFALSSLTRPPCGLRTTAGCAGGRRSQCGATAPLRCVTVVDSTVPVRVYPQCVVVQLYSVLVVAVVSHGGGCCGCTWTVCHCGCSARCVTLWLCLHSALTVVTLEVIVVSGCACRSQWLTCFTWTVCDWGHTGPVSLIVAALSKCPSLWLQLECLLRHWASSLCSARVTGLSW